MKHIILYRITYALTYLHVGTTLILPSMHDPFLLAGRTYSKCVKKQQYPFLNKCSQIFYYGQNCDCDCALRYTDLCQYQYQANRMPIYFHLTYSVLFLGNLWAQDGSGAFNTQTAGLGFPIGTSSVHGARSSAHPVGPYVRILRQHLAKFRQPDWNNLICYTADLNLARSYWFHCYCQANEIQLCFALNENEDYYPLI